MPEPPLCPDCETAADYQFNRRVGGVSMQQFECALCERQVLQPDSSRDRLMNALDEAASRRAVSLPNE